MNRVVEVVEQEGNTDADHGADHERQRGVAQRLRRKGCARQLGRAEDRDVVAVARHRQPELLGRLQEDREPGLIVAELGLKPGELHFGSGCEICLVTDGGDGATGRHDFCFQLGDLGLQLRKGCAVARRLLGFLLLDEDLSRGLGERLGKVGAGVFSADLDHAGVAANLGCRDEGGHLPDFHVQAEARGDLLHDGRRTDLLYVSAGSRSIAAIEDIGIL